MKVSARHQADQYTPGSALFLTTDVAISSCTTRDIRLDTAFLIIIVAAEASFEEF